MHERIDSLFLSENHRLALGFPPQKGFVFLRIMAREGFTYLYDRLLTEGSVATAGQISNNEFLNAFVLENSSGDDILEVEERNHIYHLFYGISPSALRTYLYVPTMTARRAPDVETITTRAKWGYIDGFESGFDDPSPRTEIFIPPGQNLTAWAIWNPLTIDITDPLLWFTGMIYSVDVIRNAQLVAAMLAGQQPVRFATIGGVTEEVQYDPRRIWDVDLIKPTASATDIAAALVPKR